MDKAELLDRILSMTCPGEAPNERGALTFTYDLHCVEATIVARPALKVRHAATGEYEYSTYEVIEVSFRSN